MTKKSNKKSLWFIIIIVICVIIILASLGVGTILIIQKLKSKTNKDKCSINCKNGNCDSNGKCICINKWSGEYCNIKPSPGPSPGSFTRTFTRSFTRARTFKMYSTEL